LVRRLFQTPVLLTFFGSRFERQQIPTSGLGKSEARKDREKGSTAPRQIRPRASSAVRLAKRGAPLEFAMRDFQAVLPEAILSRQDGGRVCRRATLSWKPRKQAGFVRCRSVAGVRSIQRRFPPVIQPQISKYPYLTGYPAHRGGDSVSNASRRQVRPIAASRRLCRSRARRSLPA
jgi:hypothetical protein